MKNLSRFVVSALVSLSLTACLGSGGGRAPGFAAPPPPPAPVAIAGAQMENLGACLLYTSDAADE